MNDIREAMLHGLRPDRTFRMAATKYLQDYAEQKKSIGDDAIQLILDIAVRKAQSATCFVDLAAPPLYPRRHPKADRHFIQGAPRLRYSE